MRRALSSLLLTVMLILTGNAASVADSAAVDSVMPAKQTESVKKQNFFEKVLDYFSESNKENNNKKFDFSIIGGPHYSSDTKFGIGLVAAGLYRQRMSDTLIQPSNVSLYGDISTVGFYLIGIRGTHIFPRDKFRINYKLYFYSFPTYFWGIGYHNGIDNDDKTKYKRLQSKAKVDFLIRLAPALFIGPSASFQYIDARHVDDHRWLWQGQDLHTTNVSAGLQLTYDTRDVMSNAYSGVYISAEQQFYPRFLGNKQYNFSSTELTANGYTTVWKGGVLASQIHARFTYGHTPWGLLSTIGGSESMRGYYDGRYRDMNAIEATLELRQHIYRRSGAVIWVGAGNVFSSQTPFKWSHTLPNYGIGYRWEFKHRVNVRLDYGFGRHTSAFVFSINEAF